MLKTLSELFEVLISTFLDTTVVDIEETPDPSVDEVAKQPAILNLNEMLPDSSVRRRRIMKRIVAGFMFAFVVILLVL